MKAKFVNESINEFNFYSDITINDIELALDKLKEQVDLKIKDISYSHALRTISPNSIPNDRNEQTIIIKIIYQASQDFAGKFGYGVKDSWVAVRCLRSEENDLIEYLEKRIKQEIDSVKFS